MPPAPGHRAQTVTSPLSAALEHEPPRRSHPVLPLRLLYAVPAVFGGACTARRRSQSNHRRTCLPALQPPPAPAVFFADPDRAAHRCTCTSVDAVLSAHVRSVYAAAPAALPNCPE